MLTAAAHALEDFAAHRSDWVTPLALDYRGTTVHEIPPNGQGIAALIALGIVEHFDLAAHRVDTAEVQHLQIEAMKLAFADVYRYVSDPRTMEVTPAQMLDRAYLAERARLIDLRRAQDFAHGTPPPAGTVYLTAADAGGMMVSLIQSNYMGFGSGIVVPGTGHQPAEPRHRVLAAARRIRTVSAPGKRPFHTIIPGFATRGGEAYASFGVMGGADPAAGPPADAGAADRLSPAAAGGARRPAVEGQRRAVGGSRAEQAPAVREGLAARGHRFASIADPYMDFGAGQFIVRSEDGYIAGSDPRRDGQAAGF